MAATSTMLPLGTPLPTFELPDAAGGGTVTSASLVAGKPVVVALICNHCPYVVRIKEGLAAFGKDAVDKGVRMIAISSNDVANYPSDAPDKMAEDAKQYGYTFPYLYDETQDVARAFDAACTPEFYVFDGQGKLAYRGQFDEARPSNDKPVTGADVRAAVDALLAGHRPSDDQKPSIGCSIKWKR